MTPLHCAARCNTSEIILELIKNGADLYEKLDEDGETVFDIFLISNEMNEFAGIDTNLSNREKNYAIQVRKDEFTAPNKIRIA
jgi:ankyrin repeat protein